MRRRKDIKTEVSLYLLLAVFPGYPAAATSALPTQLEPGEALAWVDRETPRRRCFTVDVPDAGRYWLVMHSDRPSTGPSAMVLGSEEADPRTAGRVEATLLAVAEPGEHLVCLTSDADLGRASLRFQPAGDPLEIEEVLDPLPGPSAPEKPGDPLEIEEVPDP